jgi:hypothetical protein
METTVYVTKYALTSGIEELVMDVKENPEHFNKICYGKRHGYSQSFFNNDFHLTKEEALVDAEKRRIKKIESLKKQILKYEKMSFKTC